jgi:hypothetical protein
VRYWTGFFFDPRSVSASALMRIGWGVLVTAWALTLLPDVDPFLTDGALRYDRPLPSGAWNPLDWVGWSGAPLAACLLLVVAGILTALGAWTHLSTLVALLCVVSLQRTNPTILNSGDLLIRLVGIGVLLSPSGRVLSIDELRRRRAGTGRGGSPPLRAPFGLRLLQLWVGSGYLLSAISKLQGIHWVDGSAVGWALRIEDLQRVTPPEWLFAHREVVNALTWGTLAFEALFVVLVWNRRLRPWVIGAGVAFHLGIDLFLDVGFFSWAVFVAYLAWLPDEQADRVVDTLRATLRRSSRPPGQIRAETAASASAGDRASPAAPRPPGDRDGGGAPHRR